MDPKAHVEVDTALSAQGHTFLLGLTAYPGFQMLTLWQYFPYSPDSHC